MSPTQSESPGRGSPGQSPASSAAYHNDMLSVARAADPADDDTPRCLECGHPLTAARSITRGIGPVCRARLEGTISQATGRAVVVLVIEGNLCAQLGEVSQ